MSVQDLIDRALALHQEGDLGEATHLYRDALSQSANHPTVANLLAIALDQQGEAGEAETVLGAALAVLPETEPAGYEPALNLARLLARRDALVEAIAPARRAAGLESGAVDGRALFLELARRLDTAAGRRDAVRELLRDAAGRGLCIQTIEAARGAPDESDLITAAIDLDPLDARFRLQRGTGQAARGDKRAAISFRHALLIEPALAQASNNLANMYAADGEHGAAHRFYRHAILAGRGYADAEANLAMSLARAGRLGDALGHARKAVLLNPASSGLLGGLGVHLQSRREAGAAEAMLRRALCADPLNADAWNNLASVLKPARRTEGAIRAFKRAMSFSTIEGSDAEIDAIRSGIARDLTALRETGGDIADPLSEVGLPNFYLAYHGRNDREIQTLIADTYLALCPSLAWQAPQCGTPAPRDTSRRIRIGFFSVFFYEHSIRFIAEGVIQKLDRSTFEVVLITDRAAGEITAFPPGEGPDRHVAVRHDLAEARGAIAALELDILVYCDIGMEPLSYYLAFSRLAPVQCVMQGHPVTTGVPNIDYFLSSSLMEPDDFRDHYRETCIRFADLTFLYLREPSAAPGSKSDYGLPEDKRVYFCPQTLFKFHPHFDDMLRGILERDPDGSVVLLRDRSEARTRQLADRLGRRLGPLAGRVVWLDRMEKERYYTLLALSDVMLDTPYFSGGNTTIQSLALGVPTVTYASPHVRGRITVGWCRVLDTMDLVADTPEDYARIAVACAADSAFRNSVQDRLRRNASRLFHRDQVAREHERFFESALQAALSGAPRIDWDGTRAE